MTVRIKDRAVIHRKPCPDCLGDGSYLVDACTPDAYEGRCYRCRGSGRVDNGDCLCVECQAVGIVAGIYSPDVCDEAAVALVAFWRARGINPTSNQEASHV